MSKRKPARPQPAPGAVQGPRLSPPVDFGDHPPHICRIGNDLAESERWAAALQKLREAQHGRPA